MIISFFIGSLVASFLFYFAVELPCNHTLPKSNFLLPLLKENYLFHRWKPLVSLKDFHYDYSLTQGLYGPFILVVSFMFVCFFDRFNYAPQSEHLFLIGLMGITLSVSDILYYWVEPSLFLAFSCSSFVVKWLTLGFSSFHFLETVMAFGLLSILSWITGKGLGGGDIKLLSCWTLLLRLEMILYLTFAGSILAILYVLFTPKKRSTKIPFVPFLTMGYFITLFFYFLF